jgi:hypothetical protein
VGRARASHVGQPRRRRAQPGHVALAGRHRFARYSLTFELDDAGGGITRLRALTHAAFPGVRGQIYKTLVIRSRGHVLATRLILRRVARSAAHAR